MSYKTIQTNQKPDSSVLCILSAFQAQGIECRIVGGYIRDKLLNRYKKSKGDVDFAVDLASPGDIKRVLAQSKIKYVDTVLESGTVMANLDSDSRRFDITPIKDGSSSGWDKWRQDAGQRDFTMNALYMDREGRIYDYFDGYDHLTKKMLVPVNIDECFAKPERILRFFRFMAELPNFVWSVDCEDAVNKNSAKVEEIHPANVRRELFRILDSRNASSTLGIMQKWGVLKEVFPTVGKIDTGLLKHNLPESVEKEFDNFLKIALLIRSSSKVEKGKVSPRHVLHCELSPKEDWYLYLLINVVVGKNGIPLKEFARRHGKKTLQKLFIIHGIEMGDRRNFAIEKIIEDLEQHLSPLAFPPPEDVSGLMDRMGFKTPYELYEFLQPIYEKWLSNSSNQKSIMEMALSFNRMALK